MPLISTSEDAETFTFALLAMTDQNVVKSFKAASEKCNDGAACLCLEEMTRRNLTFVLTFSPTELRAAASLARKLSACGAAAGIDSLSSQSALDRIASYWDAAADRAEAPLRSGTQADALSIPDNTPGAAW